MPSPDRPGSRVRVVVIDDNRDAADTLASLLDLHGYDVRVAYTGPDGVRVAREWAPDCVLCDIGLPGLDGYAVAAALRQYPATANARLIAITAYGSEEALRRSEEAGFEEHFVKPVGLDVLLQVLPTAP